MHSIYPSIESLVEDCTRWDYSEDKIPSGCAHAYSIAKFGYDRYNAHGIDKEIAILRNPPDEFGRVMHSQECMLSTETFKKRRWRIVRRRPYGCRADIGRILEGDMERCWITFGRSHVDIPAVRIFVSIGGNHNIGREEMSVCGATACSICEILESNGIAVEIWAACNFKARLFRKKNKDPVDMVTMFKVKPTNEYIDYSRLAHITGSAGFYRTFIWLSRIRCAMRNGINPIFSKSSSMSFGKEHMPDAMYGDIDLERTIFIPRIYSTCEAKTWIRDNIENMHMTGGVVAA